MLFRNGAQRCRLQSGAHHSGAGASQVLREIARQNALIRVGYFPVFEEEEIPGEEKIPSLSKFFSAHGEKLLHITLREPFPEVLELCPHLVDIEFDDNDLDLNDLIPSDQPHRSLRKIVSLRLSNLEEQQEVQLDMLPALREIHIKKLEWPKNE
ncbi:hypothetical protein FB45DRAFT_1021708 [Roridomyces roridus]|uniref:Uncharacterized protein n=1 Tax=Roridomyces roridus TaxID=1738132 RepID=A0AAD7FVK2_9AGAR|nr:hypothetical protein FB45DRAFT_1021708 [Roridomyces roridus]